MGTMIGSSPPLPPPPTLHNSWLKRRCSGQFFKVLCLSPCRITGHLNKKMHHKIQHFLYLFDSGRDRLQDPVVSSFNPTISCYHCQHLNVLQDFIFNSIWLMQKLRVIKSILVDTQRKPPVLAVLHFPGRQHRPGIPGVYHIQRGAALNPLFSLWKQS